MHHGREEELVLQQLRQPLATPVKLILPRVLIRDADKDSHAYDGPWYRPGKTAGGDPHLADVFDARLHQRFILARKEGKKVAFQSFVSQLSGSRFAAALLHLREKDPGGKVLVV